MVLWDGWSIFYPIRVILKRSGTIDNSLTFTLLMNHFNKWFYKICILSIWDLISFFPSEHYFNMFSDISVLFSRHISVGFLPFFHQASICIFPLFNYFIWNWAFIFKFIIIHYSCLKNVKIETLLIIAHKCAV